MRIHRSHPDDNFTILPNEMLRDARLTYAARGVLAELLTHTDGWETNADALWRLARRHRPKTAEGRRAMRSAFAELEDRGYMVRRKSQHDDGRFATALEIHDTPDHRGTESGMSVWDTGISDSGASPGDYADRGTAYRTSVGQTSADETSVGGTSSRSTNQRSTKEEVQGKEHSSALAGARAANAGALADIRARELRDFYDAVNRMTEHDVRMALLKLEKRHPRIHGQCRRRTLDHLKEGYPALLKSDKGPQNADRLAYQYALRHYSKAKNWPMWLIRPLPKPVRLKSVS